MTRSILGAAFMALAIAVTAPATVGLLAPAQAQVVKDGIVLKDLQVQKAPQALPQMLWRVGASEDEAWRIAQERDSVSVYEAFMRDYPNSRYFNQARDRRRALIQLQDAGKGDGPDRGVIKPLPAPPSPPPPPMPKRNPAPAPSPNVVLPEPPILMPPPPFPENGEVRTRTFEQRKADETTSAPGPGANTGGSAVRTVIEAVMTELLPNDQRRAQNGGAAMALLTDSPRQRARNMSLCRALFSQLDGATTGEIDIGLRKVDGVVQILRPVYWFARANRQPKDAGPSVCQTRLDNYHFARARAVMASVGLSGEGPFLAVVRTDDAAAGVIDLSSLSEADIAAMVRYFRESYSKRDRIWAPENNTPQASRNDLVRVLGELGNRISAIPRVVTRAR